MHTCAFIATSIRLQGRAPRADELDRASHEAMDIAVDAIERVGEHNRPESLAIGSYQQYGYIQGAARNPDGPEDYIWQFWGESRGRMREGQIVGAQALKAHWGAGDELIRAALDPNYFSPASACTVPSLLIRGMSDVLEMSDCYQDVFGDDQWAVQAEGKASRWLKTENYAQAHRLAQAPVQRLEQARFHVEYLKALESLHDRVFIQVDWNL